MWLWVKSLLLASVAFAFGLILFGFLCAHPRFVLLLIASLIVFGLACLFHEYFQKRER